MRNSFVFFLIVLTLLSCSDLSSEMRNGDLIFVAPADSSVNDFGSMDSAVISATADDEGYPFTHVAIVDKSLFHTRVIDATPSRGVSKRSLDDFIADNMQPCESVFVLMRPNTIGRGVLRRSVKKARSYISLPYDFSFLPNNGAYYCSELVYDSYVDGKGRHYFEEAPMNFLNSDGTLPDYWDELFRKLDMPVPQSVNGTNPCDMAKSEILRHILSF